MKSQGNAEQLPAARANQNVGVGESRRMLCDRSAPLTKSLPRYIRLGKWMSKAGVAVTMATATPESRDDVTVGGFLNPADLPNRNACAFLIWSVYIRCR